MSGMAHASRPLHDAGQIPQKMGVLRVALQHIQQVEGVETGSVRLSAATCAAASRFARRLRVAGASSVIGDNDSQPSHARPRLFAPLNGHRTVEYRALRSSHR
jgi:hypothetical protein